MDFASLGIAVVAAIVVLCYVFGEIAKASALDNKWIPIVCALSGIALGVIGMFIMPDFPANDIITAAAVGAVSGLAATGINQAKKQLSGTTE